MTSHKDTLAAALTDAGYPAPHTPDADQNKLTWCVGGNAPFIHVEDTGAVSVHCAGRCEAQFVLGPERQSAADWVALLHPQIAELIATASGGTPVPEPVCRWCLGRRNWCGSITTQTVPEHTRCTPTTRRSGYRIRTGWTQRMHCSEPCVDINSESPRTL